MDTIMERKIAMFAVSQIRNHNQGRSCSVNVSLRILFFHDYVRILFHEIYFDHCLNFERETVREGGRDSILLCRIGVKYEKRGASKAFTISYIHILPADDDR